MARKLRSKGVRNSVIFTALLILFIGIPFVFLYYQSHRSGMSMSEVIQRKVTRAGTEDFTTDQIRKDSINTEFLIPSQIGQDFTDPPQISHVQTSDLDNDGLKDIIVCDAKYNSVSWIRQYPAGTYTETILTNGLVAPAHAQIIDFDKDGDNDIITAVLGMLFPNNDKIGSVVILENDGDCKFQKRVVAEKIARVSDARAGDLDSDGDLDLAVAQFGYDDGETRWIENLGGWSFTSHLLQSLSGPINVEIADIDKDGDSDIVSIASQEWEEIYCFVNNGKGDFLPKLLWGSNNEDFGSSGISLFDMDGDNDYDILYTNGDAFDYIPPSPRPWHGVAWLENRGGLDFKYHRICNFNGAYNARPSDADKDGDTDLFVVSGFNLWDNPESDSFIWLENIGNMQFREHKVASSPTHLLTLEAGDLNNDGFIDFVTGGMHAYPPFDRMGRITLWTNNGALMSKK